jgi:opacity protein-like surface antigen
MTNGMVSGRARLAMALTMIATLCAPAAASAQIRQVSSSTDGGKQTVNFTVGWFALKGLDSRIDDDVLLAELLGPQPLLFEIKDLNSVPVGGEYLFGVGSRFEAGIGIAYSQRAVDSVYAHLTHADNTEIRQELKLRQVPVTFTGRFLLLPRGSVVEPYIGGGIVATRWRYSEIGEFVADNRDIFPARYIADGTSVGPTILGGLRAPFGHMSVGGEVRWQQLEAKGLLDEGFLTDRLDLGGWTTTFTFGVRF